MAVVVQDNQTVRSCLVSSPTLPSQVIGKGGETVQRLQSSLARVVSPMKHTFIWQSLLIFSLQ